MPSPPTPLPQRSAKCRVDGLVSVACGRGESVGGEVRSISTLCLKLSAIEPHMEWNQAALVSIGKPRFSWLPLTEFSKTGEFLPLFASRAAVKCRQFHSSEYTSHLVKLTSYWCHVDRAYSCMR